MLRSRKFIAITEEERETYTTMRLLFHAIPKKATLLESIPEMNDFFDYLVQHPNQLQIALTHVDGLAEAIRYFITEIRNEFHYKNSELGRNLNMHPVLYREVCPAIHQSKTVKKIKTHISDAIKKIPPEFHHILGLYIYAEIIDYVIIEWIAKQKLKSCIRV